MSSETIAIIVFFSIIGLLFIWIAVYVIIKTREEQEEERKREEKREKFWEDFWNYANSLPPEEREQVIKDMEIKLMKKRKALLRAKRELKGMLENNPFYHIFGDDDDD